MLRALSLAMILAGSTALAQEARTLTGSLTYLPRIALTDGAEAVFEIRDPLDRVVAEARVVTAGQQVPLAFAIDAPASTLLRFQAAIAEAGTLHWVSPEIRIGADDPDDLGELVLKPHQPMGFASAYRCGDRVIRIGHAGDKMLMDDGTDRFPLVPAVSASGAKYEAEGGRDSYFWEHQGKAMVRLDGQNLPECRITFPVGSQVITARGNEPFWTARAGDGTLTVDRLGDERLTLPITQSRLSDSGDLVIRAGEDRAALTLRNEICRDSMSGMPFPESAELALDEAVLSGCAGDSLDLLVGRLWQIETLAGDAIIGASRAEIGFDRVGGTFGTGGCNRFTGGYSLTGEGLSFGTLGSTMMACDSALMAQDARLFETLDQISRFDIDDSGSLVLLAGDTPMLRAVAGTID